MQDGCIRSFMRNFSKARTVNDTDVFGYLYSAQRKWHNGENIRLGLGLW